MTIDERLEFLLRSTEALHSQVQELYCTTHEHTEQIVRHTKQLETNAELIRTLIQIAEIQELRASALEDKNDPTPEA